MRKRSNFKIPPKALKPPRGTFIPEQATISKDAADTETKRFTVGHQFYKKKLCAVKGMGNAPLKAVIEKYKLISQYSTIPDLKKDLSVTPVTNSNHYSQFYAGLEEDIELQEFKISDGGRTFFYINPRDKIVEVIAISHHPESNKTKR